jgi:hypothetical protein
VNSLAKSKLIGIICIIICRLNTFSDYKTKKIRQAVAASRLYKRGDYLPLGKTLNLNCLHKTVLDTSQMT